ncbi:MAG: zincin-like metallopeptidase domain-containing protein [Victivallaceae bacterium]|nr:zincin-like metallopeptidase domain-containing protein [Victivallaceae bacterium]
MNSVYEKITSIIVAKLEKGIVPWHQPWASSWPPRNLITKKPYRGINLLLLSGLKYELPYFLTFKQVKRLKGSVIKDEKAHLVVFYKWLEKKDEDGNVIRNDEGKIELVPMLRFYYVFNVGQCDGIASKYIPWQINGQFNPIEEAEYIVRNMPDHPEICYDTGRACYIPRQDQINMPSKHSFSSDEELYSTLFHELVHSTGHESRLNRKGVTQAAAFGSKVYSEEELVAEMGAAFLCGEAGIANRTIDNSTAYIRGWLSRLKNDKRLLVFAAGAAQKACDFILDRQQVEADNATGY